MFKERRCSPFSMNEINASYDGADHDHVPYTHDIISDANNLYEAWLRAKKDSDWKPKVQMFEMDWLHQISLLQHEIENRDYHPRSPTEIIIRERGKERAIHGEQVRDRVVEHSLNDNVVIPSIRPYLIYDNGASLEGKGIDFTRRELVKDLVSFYHRYGNDGYVLLMDFSKYYDNIRHKELMDLFRKYITDETALYLLETIVDRFRVDVSYMTDEEYERCMETLFSSLDYRKIDKGLLSGDRFMSKHLDIGNQTSQSAGILYPAPLDNYIKIVRSVKYYARYMDDSYILHPDKEYLKSLLQDLIVRAADIGITINQRKTRIVKISSAWRFLQIQYSLNDSGRITQKINPERVTTQRRKMKKLAPKMTEKEFCEWVYAWIRSQKKYLSHKQHSNIINLMNELKGVTLDVQYAVSG